MKRGRPRRETSKMGHSETRREADSKNAINRRTYLMDVPSGSDAVKAFQKFKKKTVLILGLMQ